jgi:hypothetical protein
MYQLPRGEKNGSRAIESLKSALRESRGTRVVGLQSGDGEVWEYLYPALTEGGWPLFVLLTDPNPWDAAPETFRANAEKGVSYYPSAVEPEAVPYSLPGFRVLIEDFGRLTELRLLRVLSDAVFRGQGVAVLSFGSAEAYTSDDLWDLVERVPGNAAYAWEVRAGEGNLVIGYPVRA